jgi:hypothetical protein
MLQHTAEEFAALKFDIAARRQILVPIVKDQHGHTLDGFARGVIAEELGIKNVPVQVMSVASDGERKHLGLLLNACRRQLKDRDAGNWNHGCNIRFMNSFCNR